MTMLPRQIEPIQLAERRALLEGELQLSEMERLSTLLCENKGPVFVRLKFGKQDRNFRTICGSIKVIIKMLCQRCLEPASFELNLKVQLGIVTSEEAIKQLPDDYDPLLIKTGELISLVTLVEDEILLNLPMVPFHAIKDCSFKEQDMIEWDERNEKSTKENPFNVLKKLKSGDK